MLLPIGDDNKDRKITPFINYLLIALNIFLFIYWQRLGSDLPVTFGYAAVPGEILTGTDIITDSKVLTDPYTGQDHQLPGLQRTPVPVFLTLITSMFMHGGIAHLLGNMLFLWIFGDNIENKLGHLKYLVFYLLCGTLASLSHVFATLILGQNLLIPSLGASGAISAVLGGYLLLFPTRGVHVWLFLFFVVTIPAFIVVGFWFVFQVLNGLGTLGGEEAGGIAYAAHIGGFISGLFLVKSFIRKAPRRKVW
ncbi:rhomboid family intramembrane serine protease [Segetibacter sp.]|jgi:membrane associated rhomboid family serine protease|uniref:rhomboid family intramembrane serine protease n=1 Tax=Segetibacter sp. TaxID=2231182 RepID=UPI00261AFB0D|nr:rhomboid family intramembrane serine protease [Segetibacter sp.]MCW3080118.1 Peptidase rhomboid domain [Segetibacter sp.]